MSEALHLSIKDKKITGIYEIKRDYEIEALFDTVLGIPCPKCPTENKEYEDEKEDCYLIIHEGKLTCNVCIYVAANKPKVKITLEVEEED